MFSFVDPKKIKDFGNNSNMVVTDEFNKSFMATRPAEKMVGGIQVDTAEGDFANKTSRDFSDERSPSDHASTSTKRISLNDIMN